MVEAVVNHPVDATAVNPPVATSLTANPVVRAWQHVPVHQVLAETEMIAQEVVTIIMASVHRHLVQTDSTASNSIPVSRPLALLTTIERAGPALPILRPSVLAQQQIRTMHNFGNI